MFRLGPAHTFSELKSLPEEPWPEQQVAAALRRLFSVRKSGGREIIRPPVFFMRMHGTLRMVGSILEALNPCGFQGWVGFGKFLYAFVIGVLNGRKPLSVSRLPGAVRSNFPRIRSQFVRCSFVSLRVSFGFTVFAHRSSSASLDADLRRLDDCCRDLPQANQQQFRLLAILRAGQP